MSNQENKQKIAQMKKTLENGAKIIKKIGGKILKIGEKTTVKTANCSKKQAKLLYQKYSTLNAKGKKKLRRGLLVGGIGFAGIAGGIYMSQHFSFDDEASQQTDTRADSIMSAITKTYKITDKESFIRLYEASLPLIQASLIPTEIYREKGYNDGTGKGDNTIGIGNYEFPEGGNLENPKWISTSEYLKKHPGFTVDFETAIKLVDWYFRVRKENGIEGQRLEMLYRHLKGAEINPHQFTACATVTFNSPSRGYEFCDTVSANYNNPVKCAYFLTTLLPKKKNCRDGILVRHSAEACMFLYPEYALAAYSLKQKDAINSKGVFYSLSSVTQLPPDLCSKVKDDLSRGDTVSLGRLKDCIIKYVCKDGRTIEEMASAIKDEKVKADFLRYYIGATTVSYESKRAEITYADAVKEYQKGNYEKALECFQKLRAGGYDGADLRNDIALTHYKLGHYQQCIEECRAVLNTYEKHLHPAATYNAGKAYEALGNYERAQINYESSMKKAKELGMNDTLIKVYKNAVKRTDSIMNALRSKQITLELQKNKVAAKNNKNGPAAAKKSSKTVSKAKTNKAAAQKNRQTKSSGGRR